MYTRPNYTSNEMAENLMRQYLSFCHSLCLSAVAQTLSLPKYNIYSPCGIVANCEISFGFSYWYSTIVQSSFQRPKSSIHDKINLFRRDGYIFRSSNFCHWRIPLTALKHLERPSSRTEDPPDGNSIPVDFYGRWGSVPQARSWSTSVSVPLCS